MSPQKIERKAKVVLLGLHRASFLDGETSFSLEDVAGFLGLRNNSIPAEVLDYLISHRWAVLVLIDDSQHLRITDQGFAQAQSLLDTDFGRTRA